MALEVVGTIDTDVGGLPKWFLSQLAIGTRLEVIQTEAEVRRRCLPMRLQSDAWAHREHGWMRETYIDGSTPQTLPVCSTVWLVLGETNGGRPAGQGGAGKSSEPPTAARFHYSHDGRITEPVHVAEVRSASDFKTTIVRYGAGVGLCFAADFEPPTLWSDLGEAELGLTHLVAPEHTPRKYLMHLLCPDRPDRIYQRHHVSRADWLKIQEARSTVAEEWPVPSDMLNPITCAKYRNFMRRESAAGRSINPRFAGPFHPWFSHASPGTKRAFLEFLGANSDLKHFQAVAWTGSQKMVDPYAAIAKDPEAFYRIALREDPFNRYLMLDGRLAALLRTTVIRHVLPAGSPMHEVAELLSNLSEHG
jgi:hypothetical protein